MDTPTLVILAGGASSRMWPLREKSLLRFGDQPLLLAQLARYQSLGFSQAVIIGNPENTELIRELTSDVAGMSVQVGTQPEPKGMGNALLRAGEHLPLDQHPAVYVTQVHDVTDMALHESILAAYRADPSASYLAGVERDEYFPGGYLIIDSQDRINGIIEKPGAANRPSNLVSLVAHIHADAARLMQAIEAQYRIAETPDDHYERAMDALMPDHVFKVARYRGHWSALKYPWHVLDIMDYFLSQIKGQTVQEGAFVHKNAALVGDVFIAEGAKVFPGAAVVGPAYIGSGTIVGNNALVRASMVLDRCEVGYTTEVARSYVADQCSMHACRVLDSVFAPNVNFSAGCTTANLRMDRGNVSMRVKGEKMDTGRGKLGAVIGQGAFLGVDVMTMPGIKIGEGAQVGPGAHVYSDLSDRTRLLVKQTQTLTPID